MRELDIWWRTADKTCRSVSTLVSDEVLEAAVAKDFTIIWAIIEQTSMVGDVIFEEMADRRRGKGAYAS